MPGKATPATLNRRYRQTGCWIGRGPASAVQRPPGHGSSADLADSFVASLVDEDV
jgi:hypothetical protein